MKISVQWLGDYVAHGLDVPALADRLTMAGLEVDDIERLGEPLDGVVVGRVVSAQRHPNADRLSLCRVDLGAGEPVSIVCGAPNVAAGQLVAVATAGTTLSVPDKSTPGAWVSLTIKRAKIRGEESCGMICAADELGLSDDHAGILVLEGDAVVGEPFRVYMERRGVPLVDHVLDVAITPNRPDAISHIGVARDVAAVGRLPLRRPTVDMPTPGGETADWIAVTIEAPDACRRYVAMIVEGVSIRESPAWLLQRLRAIGLRPRNNVVDVTNFVLFECGQPLHAFDYDRIAGRRIVVRRGRAGEPFTTLDGKARTLTTDTLMIADGERAVAIAGIMGGENSEVSEETTTVLIESAYFDPSTVRRAARRLGMQTDASYRFERGVDSSGQVWAAARAAALIAELGGGRIVPGLVDAHPAPVPRREVHLRPSRVAHVLGMPIGEEEIIETLQALGFEPAPGRLLRGEPALACVVPGFRPDVEREIDLIEEIARIHGFDRIPLPDHVPVAALPPFLSPAVRTEQRVRVYLAGLGFREIYTNSMLSRNIAQRYNLPVLTAAGFPGGVVETLKPISQEMAALRPTLLPGVLGVLSHNRNRGVRALRFMEFGHVFSQTDAPGTFVPGYGEHTSLLFVAGGPAESAHWTHPERLTEFADLKGVVEGLLGRLGVTGVSFKASYEATPATRFHLTAWLGGQPVGVLAALSEAAREAHDLDDPVYFAEFHWDRLAAAAPDPAGVTYRLISRFPTVDRDLAVLVDERAEVGALLEIIRGADTGLLRHLHVFDVYKGERIPAGKKSVAFGLQFGADRTLLDEEVDRAVAGLLRALESGCGAELRR